MLLSDSSPRFPRLEAESKMNWSRKLQTVFLVSVGLLQILEGVSSTCSVGPPCVPADACEACKKMKCDMAQSTPKLGPCNPTTVSPLIGGNQCCDTKTVDRLSRRRRKRQAINEPESVWNNPISYVFDSSIDTTTALATIPGMLNYIQSQTCLRFKRVYSNSTSNRMNFTSGSACTAYVGQSAFNSTPITVMSTCLPDWGLMLYYTIQSVGMWHQTQRPDRDTYVTIVTNNTDSTHDGDFATIPYAYLTTYGLPYDYASIQHFPGKVFSINGGYTILTKDPLYQSTIGQRVELSFGDAKTINMLYCQTICSGSPLLGTCLKGGYQDPNSCTACKCPDGLTGQFCEKFDTATGTLQCGGSINASLTEMNITSPGYSTPGYYDSHTSCVWYIVAPNGGQISLRFTGYFGLYQDELSACQHWVEIRTTAALNETGHRFCGTSLPTVNIVSDASAVLILFRSNLTRPSTSDRRGFEIAYKIVNATTCAYVKCLNGGACANNLCICPSGFTGVSCEIGPTAASTVFPSPSSTPLPTSCNPNPCRNNGSCSMNVGAVTCSCTNGFTGQFCTKGPGSCGGCNIGPGSNLDPKCIIPEKPARTCQILDFVESTSGWWFLCRRSTRVVTRNVPCTWSVCCDNAMDFGCGCGVIGWTDWCPCSVNCGGAIQTRTNWGPQSDRIGNKNYRVVATDQRNCSTQICNCVSNSAPSSRGRSCSACNGPRFTQSGNQCVRTN